MFALTIELLTGRYVATAHHDRDMPEWPPHPARLFSALVAAHHEQSESATEERAVLEWLERLSAPTIAASDATERAARTHYVPVNDAQVVGITLTERRYVKAAEARKRMAAASTPARQASAERVLHKALDVSRQVSEVGVTPVKQALELLPGGRGRQPRTFPSMTPAEPTVTYLWPDNELPAQHRAGLTALLERVTRLGHSSTLVWCRLEDAPPPPTHVPDVEGALELRTVGPGQLAALERRHALHRGITPRSMPSTMTRYRRTTDARGDQPPLTSWLSGEWFVFQQVAGQRLHGRKSLSIARAVRSALMAHLRTEIPPLISGHLPDGQPVSEPHLAVVPLPFLDHQHASGIVLGFALQLPSRSSLLDRRDDLLRAVGRWEGAHPEHDVVLHTEAGRELVFRRATGPASLQTLRRSRWAGPSRQWLTATPLALDRHPGPLFADRTEAAATAHEAARATIHRACLHVGLPEPNRVELSDAPFVRGAEPSSRYLPFLQGKSRLRRRLVHAWIRFDAPIAGPLLLGAGRYLGQGLMLPDRERPA